MRRKLKVGLLGALAGVLVLALAACGSGDTNSGSTSGSSSSASGGVLRLGGFIEPSSFDPALAQEGNYIPFYQAVYDTLIKREPDGKLSPMLATKWAYNADNTGLTLTLRDDVTFTDGKKFDSSVVKKNIEHFKAANGPQATLAVDVKSVETPDATTAVIVLSQPNPSLTVALTNALGFMASPDAVGSAAITGTPVGSGPYTLDKANTVVGSQYTYVRNPKYWGDKLPYASVVMMVLTDETARLNALKSGQINAAVFQRPASGTEIKAAGLQLLGQEADWAGLMLFDRNGSMQPAFADERVRQALNFAIDKEAILKQIYLGRGQVTDQIFGTATLAYEKKLDTSRYAYDPAKAKQLLAAAGYASGLTLEIPVSPAFDPAIYTTLIQDWSDVGINVTKHEYGPGETIPALVSGKHYMAFMTLFTPNDWTTINQALTPTATWNPLHFSDPTAADLVQKIRLAADDPARKGYAQQLNEYIVDQAWFAPFFRFEQTYGADKKTHVELQVEQAVPSIYNYSPAS